MLRNGLLLTVLLALGGGARADEPAAVRLTFQPTAAVDGAVIHLRDVARIDCADTRLAATLRDLDIGASPLPGFTRPLIAAYTRVRLRPLGIPDSRIALSGADTVTVTRRGQSVSAAEIARCACTAAEAARPGAAARVTASLRDIFAPAGLLELRAGAPSLTEGLTGTVSVSVRVDGRPVASVSVSVRLSRPAAIVVAARAIPAGTVLTEADLTIAERTDDTGNGATLARLDLAIGRQLGAPLAAGEAVRAGALRLVPVVRRGDRVKVLCRGTSFAVACTAEALQDGGIGQTVRVRNIASGGEFTARITAADLLEVVF
jgi:flagella basal body P-ring formation protein FlgA